MKPSDHFLVRHKDFDNTWLTKLYLIPIIIHFLVLQNKMEEYTAKIDILMR